MRGGYFTYRKIGDRNAVAAGNALRAAAGQRPCPLYHPDVAVRMDVEAELLKQVGANACLIKPVFGHRLLPL